MFSRRKKVKDDDDLAVPSHHSSSILRPRSNGFLNKVPFIRNFNLSRINLTQLLKYLILFVLLILVSNFTSIQLPFDIPKFRITDPKVVIILLLNEGGGVLKWKGAQEWSVERSSITNKRHYLEKHGYLLAVKDLTLKRRYSHEWREGWEKVDIIKQTMRQYPSLEWFWWLDLHTYIMEPQYSLEEHIFDHLLNVTYSSLEEFNPLGLPTDVQYTDYHKSPIDLIITQDCGGFNLGSFFIRRSEWTETLLDTWWDPVMYEQMHMQWEHKEQDLLESLYLTQPWIRERTLFLPLRLINSFPPGLCYEFANDPRFFYSDKDRDFLINMAGCEYGRDCWSEMEYYKLISRRLHKRPWWKVWK